MSSQKRTKKQVLAVKHLVEWYERGKRAFPWREDPHPYKVWLAEVMSQQTQMATLLPFYEKFLVAFPDVFALAKDSEERVLGLWAGLGYYSRARNLHRAAQAIATAGDFPKTYEGWIKLPGIGPYTAAAIVSQAFGIPEPVWDGNVHRVLSRVLAARESWTQEFKQNGMDLLRQWITGVDPSAFNQALMELGSQVCTPKRADCEACPLSEVCEGRENALFYPAPKARKDQVALDLSVFVFLKRERKKVKLWLSPRGPGHWFPGLWDFSTELGGSKQPVLSLPFSTLEKKENWKAFGRAQHQITHHKIQLIGYAAWDKSPESTSEGRWFDLEELQTARANAALPLSTTAQKLMPSLIQWLSAHL